eukprot:NODE_10167_length_344_cov_13.637288_g9257_i0.p1 GENE.NODE_10167_length_344_cov_13.637288_g9257_i0~~NODE_10167_length_344_cov_13.637288_g9257_i0.p1  ORF type:complete len:103 (+),score=17.26 NODE_10167_length_344_cov_13.637288_g9257_i0:34-342(+)
MGDANEIKCSKVETGFGAFWGPPIAMRFGKNNKIKIIRNHLKVLLHTAGKRQFYVQACCVEVMHTPNLFLPCFFFKPCCDSCIRVPFFFGQKKKKKKKKTLR